MSLDHNTKTIADILRKAMISSKDILPTIFTDGPSETFNKYLHSLRQNILDVYYPEVVEIGDRLEHKSDRLYLKTADEIMASFVVFCEQYLLKTDKISLEITLTVSPFGVFQSAENIGIQYGLNHDGSISVRNMPYPGWMHQKYLMLTKIHPGCTTTLIPNPDGNGLICEINFKHEAEMNESAYINLYVRMGEIDK